jgi:hypothetical protein
MERMWLTRTDRLETITRGATAGASAGALLGALEMAGAAEAGDGWLLPWRMASSLLLDRGAFTASAGVVLLTGSVVHLGMSVATGTIAAMVYEWSSWSRVHRLGPGAACAAGAVFGCLVWLVNFALAASAFLPWMWRLDQGVQLAFHLGYGIALGLALHALGRYARNPPDSAQTA